MSDHSQRYRIVGFIDASHKWAGTAQCTHFAPEFKVETKHLPSFAEMRYFATLSGLFPSNKPGSSPDICKPIYHVIGEGFDYLKCTTCYPARANLADFVEQRI